MALAFRDTLDPNVFYSVRADSKIWVTRTASSDVSKVKVEIYKTDSCTPTVEYTLEFEQSGAVEEFAINPSKMLKSRELYLETEFDQTASVINENCISLKAKVTVTVGASTINTTINLFNNLNFHGEITDGSGGNYICNFYKTNGATLLERNINIYEKDKVVSMPSLIPPDGTYNLSDIMVKTRVHAILKTGNIDSAIYGDYKWYETSKTVSIPIGLNNIASLITQDINDVVAVYVSTEWYNSGTPYKTLKSTYYYNDPSCYNNAKEIYYYDSLGIKATLTFALNEEKLNRSFKDIKLMSGAYVRMNDDLTKKGTLTSFPIIYDEYEDYEQLMLSHKVLIKDDDGNEREILLTNKKIDRLYHNNKLVKQYKFQYMYKDKLEL